MKLVKAFGSGLVRTKHSVRPLIIIWIINLLAISLVAGPGRKLVLSVVGNSNASQMIKEGFNIDFWTDLGSVGMAALSSLSTGLFLLIVILFFVNVFFNGGLFDSLRSNSCRYRIANFFKASAKLFFGYLTATVLMILMIILFAGLIIGLPIVITKIADIPQNEALPVIWRIARIIIIFVLPLFLLIIDYARVWMAVNGPSKVFKAIGYGFKATFTSFFSSYIFMIVIVAIQTGYIFLASKLLGMSPQTGGGLFLLFLLSQVLFFIRLMLRAWRYGGVTALYMM